ncbi:POTRA domain-containing protein [Polaribacter sp. Asnod6-C07]|uniref:POTRA domain-containing protein n=1 Tax=Polaribacter sp. Asnod6-C07 TaxID=3160582 RepID=UPI00386C734E
MKLKQSTYLITFFTFLIINDFLAQELLIKIIPIEKRELSSIQQLEYQKKHDDSVSIFKEIDKISEHLKNIGYFTNTIDSIKKEKQHYTVYISLKTKIEKAIIKTHQFSDLVLKDNKVDSETISIHIRELKILLSNITKKLEKDGKSFSKVQLKNIVIKKDILYADLDVNQTKKRTINKIIIKGYEDFPKPYLKNYFKIKTNTLFNQKKLKQISNNSKNLDFIKEVNPPEVLFTKDSTFIYMYLKKLQKNSFDGIVNFASQEDGGVLLNGNIDFKLHNILNSGEKFELFWNSIGDERQELKLSTEIPFIFNSKLTPLISLSIYKQDSTFLNTNFNSKLFYNINPSVKIAATYYSESSENLAESTNNNIETFKNIFWGIEINYRIAKNDYFFNDKFSFNINPTFGTRKYDNTSTNQIKIKTSATYIWDISQRSSFYIKNTSGHLNSDTYLDNEFFRLGGANSLRGFNEQSIFSPSFSFFNTEYRFLTNKESYLYTITDLGYLKLNSTYQNFLSIGLGYLFTINKFQIKISTAIGKKPQQNLNFNESKIIINWKTNF